MRPDGSLLGSFGGGGISGAWGVAVDGNDNVWVANFGRLLPGSDFTTGGITALCGTNTAACQAGLKTGDAITPATGYTLPSAGAQVLLSNGTPLYGNGGAPSYAPLMRATSVVIDQGGNVWTTNNWKPNFNIDVASNPGGDGIVIFVGLAKPPAKGR